MTPKCAGRHPRRSLAQVAAVLLALGVGQASGADEGTGFEEIETVDTAAVLPKAFLRSTHYAIDPGTKLEGNFYQFGVTSEFGNFQVSSLGMLRKRLHEIATIAELAPRLDKNDMRLDRSPDGRRGVGSEYVVDIISDPVGTAAQLLGNIQYNVEQTLAGTAPEAGTATRSAAIDLNPGPHKRSAAAQLGVDVYSSNPALQGMLEKVAAARSAGRTASSISPLVQNVYAGDRFGSGVFNQRLESRLKNTSSENLNAEFEAVLDELGLTPRARIRFLSHPAYTPRSRLFFLSYLGMLSPVRGLDLLVAAANQASTEADALAYVSYARMLAWYQINHQTLTEVITETRYPTLVTSERKGILALPLDYLSWSAQVAAAVATLEELDETRKLQGMQLLLAGSPTRMAGEKLAEHGIELSSGYSYPYPPARLP